MIKTDIADICELIDKLNNEYIKQTGDEYTLPTPFVLSSDGCEVEINFMGQPVWDSINDERQYIDELDDYESLEMFIRNMANKIIAVITKATF